MDPEQIDSQLEKARNDELSLDELESLGAMLEKAQRWQEACEVCKQQLQAQQQLQAREQQLQDCELLLQKSIEYVYRKDGNPSFPSFDLNKLVHPSIEGCNLRLMDAAYNDGDDGSEIWERVRKPEFAVPVRGPVKQGGKLLPSYFDPLDFPLSYANEVDVQQLARTMVNDAIECIHGRGVLVSAMGISIFGITPGIVVIFRGSRIIFVMEIKSPDREGTDDDVFGSTRVGGQIWLYLMAMKVSGIENPMGAICTFNKIRVVSLNKMESHKFEDAFEILRNGELDAWRLDPKDEKKKASEITNEFNSMDPSNSFSEGLMADEDGVEVFKSATLFGDKMVRESEFVFPTLVLCLLTAAIENKSLATLTNDEETLTEVSPDDDLSHRLYGYGMEDLITFALTPKDFKVKKMHPPEMSGKFFLVSAISMGNGAEVRLALTPCGCPAAIKFYKSKPSHQLTPEDRKTQNNDMLEVIDVMCTEELKIWDILYPDRKKRKVTLGGRSCLLMEYGKPLLEEERDDFGATVEKELRRFLEAGYAYERSNFRWRHVLKDLDNKVFMSDLGSLEKVGEEVNGGVEIPHAVRQKVEQDIQWFLQRESASASIRSGNRAKEQMPRSPPLPEAAAKRARKEHPLEN